MYTSYNAQPWDDASLAALADVDTTSTTRGSGVGQKRVRFSSFDDTTPGRFLHAPPLPPDVGGGPPAPSAAAAAAVPTSFPRRPLPAATFLYGRGSGGSRTPALARRAAARRASRNIAPPTLADLQAATNTTGGKAAGHEGAELAARALLAEGYVAWSAPKSDPHAFIIATVEGGARHRRYVWAGGGRNPREHGIDHDGTAMAVDDTNNNEDDGGGGEGGAAGAAGPPFAKRTKTSGGSGSEGVMEVHADDVQGATGTEEWEVAPTGYRGGLSTTGTQVLCPPGPRASITLKPNEHFVYEPPHDPDTRFIKVISGPAGVGKSTIACDDLIRFRSLRPNAPAYLITALETEDESLPTAKRNPQLGLKKLNPRALVRKPMPLKLLAGALVIVDDVESMKPDEQKAVRSLVEQICVRGRCHEKGKGGVSLIYCMHLPSKGMETRVMLNECDYFVFFPYNPGSYGTMLHALQRYVGLSETQAQAAMREKTRTLTIRKNAPRIMIGDGTIMVLPRPFAEKAKVAMSG